MDTPLLPAPLASLYGFYRYAQLAGITLSVRDDDVFLCGANGARAALVSSSTTYIATIVKEPARHVILQSLQQCVTPVGSERPARKDIVGITPWIVLHATLKLLSNRMSQQDGGGFRFSFEDRRVLKRIIAGSICAKDHLKAMKVVESDSCPCAECHGARCTTDHIFWHCSAYAPERGKLIQALDDYEAKVRRRSVDRAEAIKHLRVQTYFRHCGLCTAPPDALGDLNRLSDELDEATLPEYLPLIDVSGYPASTRCTPEGRIIVYTDGSAVDTTSRLTARAGWGVNYAEGSSLNASSFLKGPVQISRRAELRALLHVVRTASRPHLVRADCKHVVDAFQQVAQRAHINPN